MKTIGTGRESSLEDDDVVVVSLDVDWCEGMSTPRYLCMLRKDAVPYFSRMFNGTILTANPSSALYPQSGISIY